MKKLFLLVILTLASFSCKKEKHPTMLSAEGNYEVLQKSEFWMVNENGDTLSTMSGFNNEVVDVKGVTTSSQVSSTAVVNGVYFIIKQFEFDDYSNTPPHYVHQLWLERQDKTNLQEGDILSYHLGKRE